MITLSKYIVIIGLTFHVTVILAEDRRVQRGDPSCQLEDCYGVNQMDDTPGLHECML